VGVKFAMGLEGSSSVHLIRHSKWKKCLPLCQSDRSVPEFPATQHWTGPRMCPSLKIQSKSTLRSLTGRVRFGRSANLIVPGWLLRCLAPAATAGCFDTNSMAFGHVDGALRGQMLCFSFAVDERCAATRAGRAPGKTVGLKLPAFRKECDLGVSQQLHLANEPVSTAKTSTSS
jgi:hypothetical protein